MEVKYMKSILLFVVFTSFFFFSCNNEIETPISTIEKNTNNTDINCCAFSVRMIVQQYNGYSYVNCMDRTFIANSNMSPNCNDFEWFVTYYMMDDYRINCSFSYISGVECSGYFGLYEKPDMNTQPVFYTWLPYDPDNSIVEQTFYTNDLDPNGHLYYSILCVAPVVKGDKDGPKK
jgi:hypothetical protein